MEFFKSVLELLNELEAESNRAIFGIGRIENSNNITMKSAIEFDDKEKLGTCLSILSLELLIAILKRP